MSEKIVLTRIYFHNDDDTGMYKVGEVDGVFTEGQLQEYIRRFGAVGLIDHLSYLIYQVKSVERFLVIDGAEKSYTNKATNEVNKWKRILILM